jgi:hypothetical protein
MSYREELNILFFLIIFLTIATIPRKYALRAFFSLLITSFGISIGFGAFPVLRF